MPQPPTSRPLDVVSQRVLRLTINSPGILDTLCFDAGSSQTNILREEDIEIEVHVVGINFKDIAVALAQFSATSIGLEGSGVVSALGVSSPQRAISNRRSGLFS